ncbi:unnamed protein product [Thelazia callipaeda]|uniref:Matrix-remodeling-associated protein 7 helical domain-containing protein n=1 Tax=Thelazia callipaeda TaxID=103827 RepID=A0A0N5CWQ7_THECL|nr:unnamed protein product [Thelazia callipaeda]
MRVFEEDDDDSFRSPDTIAHPLPAYNYAVFFREYRKTCLATIALFTVAFSMYLWRWLRLQQEEQFHHDWLNDSVFKKILRRIFLKSSSTSMNGDSCDTSSMDWEINDSFDRGSIIDDDSGIQDISSKIPKSELQEIKHTKDSFILKKHMETWSSEQDEAVFSLSELHGKLATADLRARAKKLEKVMTEGERREEQLAQQKQLESICELIMQKPEKFGVHDKSEIMEQMKLYAI